MSGDKKFIIVLIAIVVMLAGIFAWKVNSSNKADESYTTKTEKIEIDKKYEKELERPRRQESNPETLSIIMMIIGYLILGAGIYNIARYKEIENAWMAFVPYLQWIIISKIAFNTASAGIIYIIIALIQIWWGNIILTIVDIIINLFILYSMFSEISDKPSHNLGNWAALEFLAVVVGAIFGSDTGSAFWIAFAAGGRTIVGSLYVYYVSRKNCEI